MSDGFTPYMFKPLSECVFEITCIDSKYGHFGFPNINLSTDSLDSAI
mgnify:FL=1